MTRQRLRAPERGLFGRRIAPLERPRDWVLTIALLIAVGTAAVLVGGTILPAGFAGGLVGFAIAVVQRFRRAP
jgi:hypothetical protein